jgi:hypothetical protein
LKWGILALVALQLLFALTLGFAVVSAVALMAVIAWRFVLAPARAVPDLSFDRVCSLPVERYMPMLRLLDENDLRFLQVQPGFTKQLVGRVRRHRYRMFVSYLRSLRRDFNGLTAALKFILTHADQDRANLASLLVHAQVRFCWAYATASVRAYAWLHGFGRVDAEALLAAFDGVQAELRTAVPQVVS